MSYAGNSDSATTGFCPAPPPPPPPPPTPGQVPALKINTAEAPRPRRQQSNNDPYEPPAAIQNAMMTKDKKPFTYTPGMGGKLDLSQIRSPRMARRVAKNANDEGIEGPPKSALESKPTPSTIPGNIYVQPQVAVPVFPTNLPTLQPNVNRTPSTHVNRVPSNVSNSQYEPPRNVVVGNEGKVTPITIVPSVPTTPQSPTTPPQVTLSKAPTPWLQNKPKQSEELPEWAKRASANANKPIEVQSSFNDNLPAATNVYQLPQQQQIQSFGQPQNTQNIASQRQQDRVVPVRIEDRPSVFSVKNEPAGHHQFKQAPNQQQRWGQPSPQSQQQYQQQQHNPQSGGTRIIPIMVEDNNGQSSSQGRTIPVDVQGSKIIIQRGGPAAAAAINQPEPGPVQSRSFRVLQKITDTDSDTDVDGNSEQIRKLQLTEDDKILMNKFKDQVDGENYLHQEEDPRYRGAAIPSRAFRFLQNMTDSGEVPSTSNAPRQASAINKKQNRNSKSFEEAQANLPASEQQVQEPKKYMGSAIPSRSFRILQAMTSPENIAPQENRQQENFTSRTENSVTGNQQSGVFFPPNCPPSPAYWNPENGWWGYYPVQYAAQNCPTNGGVPSSSPSTLNVSYNPYAYCNYGADPNSFAYYPVYDQNYPQNYNHNQINDQNYQIHGYLPMNVYPAAEQQTNYRHEEQNLYEKNNNNNNNNYEDKVYTKDNDEVKKECKEVKEDDKPVINVNEVSTIVKEPTKNNNTKYLTVPKWTKSTTSPAGRISTSNDESKKLSDDSKTETESDSDTDSDSSDSDSDSSSDSESSDDSSDSSTSSSDNESTSEYHAYVNELKIAKVITRPSSQLIESAEKLQPDKDKDCFIKSFSGETISEDAYEHSSRLSSEKLSCSDCDSDADDEYQIESLNNDCILPHQLSVIYEDAEQTETESESRKLDTVKEAIKGEDDCVPFSETAGDPPDDNDHTTVSVSLPLRFKFSVSENNEDVTTVIVGDSTIKSATRFDSEDSIIRGCGEPDENNEVHVNFNIKNNNNTSVDFTLKKHKGINDESFDTEFTLINEESKFNLSEKRGESLNAKMDENANLKNDFKLVECNENVETEFTVRKKKTDVVRHVWKKDLDLDEQKDIETTVKNEEPLEDTITEYTVRDQTNNSTENGYDLEYEVTTSKAEMNENIHKEIIEQESLKVKEREMVQTEFGVKKIQKIEENNAEDETDDKNFDYTIVQNFNTARRLLSVQNSRDETDDEDSGVTSDMSRIISEVDTDSECASIKRMNKYQRTQTHSRLFKLLNDDAVLAEEDKDNSSEEFYSPARREHLSLPLKSNVFNYDENNYYSNYSSGITSPDYSPLCEQSWRRIHDGRSIESENSCSSVTTPNDCVDHMSSELTNNNNNNNNNLTIFGIGTTEKPAPNDDPYFQTWKKVASPVEFDYDILPSIAFKKLKNGMANFNAKGGNRINVLCPRIKSSKNVPKTLQVSQEEKSSRKTTASSIPFLSTISSLKNGHC